jgi:hypothetical protein
MGQAGTDVDSDWGYFLADGVKIDLADYTRFKTRRGSNGALTNYTVITRLGTDLNGSYDPNGLQWSGVNAALGADIDASLTTNWNNGKMFVPGFRSRFAGLGHSIDGLSMRALEAHVPAAERNTRGGLFTTVDFVQDLRLTNLYVEVQTGNRVGGVTGVLNGRMRNVHVSGQVTVTTDATRFTSIGGLVGHSWGRISDNSSAATVTATDNTRDVGGLVGTLQAQSGYTATIERSRNTGAVTDSTYVGGLVGEARGIAISQSFSTGSATAPLPCTPTTSRAPTTAPSSAGTTASPMKVSWTTTRASSPARSPTAAMHRAR